MHYNDPVLGKKIEDALADIKAADIPMAASRKIERLICLLDEPDADTARIISQIDDEADNLAAKGFVDEAEMVSDAIATLRQLGESKKSNRKYISENATTDKLYLDAINAAKRALKGAKIKGQYAVEKKLQDWFDDDSETIDRESIEKLYDIAVYFDISYLIEATWKVAEYLDGKLEVDGKYINGTGHINESKKSSRKLIRESDNSYIDDSKEETTPAAAAEKIVYDVYAALKAFGASRFMTIDEIRSIYEDLSDLRGSKAEDAAYEDFKSIASDLRGIADEVEDMGDYYEEAEALRYAATLLAGRVDESKKVDRKINKRSLKESEDLANLIAEVKDVKEEAESREDSDFLDLADDLDSWLSEVDSNGLDRAASSDLYEVADYYEKTNAAGLTKVLFDICKRINETLYESKKRKVLGRVSMKEAKKALKEDVDYDLLLNAFTTNLDSAGVEYQMDDDKVYYVNNSDKVKEIAQQVCHEFNDYAKPVFSDPNSKKFYQWVTFTDNDEPTKAGEGSGELTAYQKSIIEDMAENDYEVGHPMSEDDALEWFSSGEEEDIPTDLAQEAANYYFEAFDQAREDDNSDYDDEE